MVLIISKEFKLIYKLKSCKQNKGCKKVAVLEVALKLIIKGIAGILYLVKTILKTILKQNKNAP